MAGINLKVKTTNQSTAMLQRQASALAKLPEIAEREFVKNTPVRSGNARNKTRRSGDRIEANYAYASVLDSGSSEQSPKGMTEPTTKELEKQFKKIIARK